MKHFRAFCASTLVISTCAAALGVSISEVGGGGGHFVLSDNSGSGAGGLSGITYDASDDAFYAVNDSDSKIYPIDFDINLNTGAINSGTVGTPIQLNTAGGVAFAAGTRDQEGIAFDPATQSVWVSNEGNPNDAPSAYAPTLSRHSLTTGNQTAAVTLPAVFVDQNVNGVRVNRSLESLDRQSNGQAMWTANEAALNLDGPAPAIASGTRVRLTKFDGGGANLVGQWVYETDGNSSGFFSALSTLSDLLVLPDGTLIAMERAAGVPSFRIRLYEVDFTNATEVSGENALSGSETLVSKTLLWEKTFTSAADNFEGLALGPALTDGSGDYSLILTADNDNGTAGQLPFYALRISGVPEPAILGFFGAFPALLLRHRP